MRHRFAQRSRGVSLVEAMVALAIMGFGMLAVVGVQATLRLNADIAKQRSEATRIGQEAMEDLRAFKVVETTAGQTAFADITPTAATNVTGLSTNTTYRISRAVVDYTAPPSKALSVTVAWNDRSGQPQQVVLRSVVAAAAPALSGTLAVRRDAAAGGPTRRPLNRHPTIPVQAREIGGGKSAFVPGGQTRYILVFNNLTGAITGVCDRPYWDPAPTNDSLVAADVASCDNNFQGQLLSGYVRFWRDRSGPELTAANAEDPAGPALRLSMELTLTSTGHASGSFCIDDASATSTALFNQTLAFVSYFCAIRSNADALWSGTTAVEAQDTNTAGGTIDWSITAVDSPSTTAPTFRVCRYTPAASDGDTVPNRDHPRNYADVSGNLTEQNFFVIPTNKHCPTDVAANPSAGDLINSNTLQHQPAP
ncbi:MAG: prepilin-type N-terminal cleavage/methylation domain-containing protein [Burkholderiaceae bacterium]